MEMEMDFHDLLNNRNDESIYTGTVLLAGEDSQFQKAQASGLMTPVCRHTRDLPPLARSRLRIV